MVHISQEHKRVRILVVRNDKLGDFMLCIPALAVIVQNLPNVHISFLVSKQVSKIARQCPLIDKVIIDEGCLYKYQLFKNSIFDAVIVFYSTFSVAFFSLFSKAKFICAPKTKWWQIFYANALKQQRSQSIKTEYEYNIDLVLYYFNKIHNLSNIKYPQKPFWRLANKLSRQDFLDKYNLPIDSNLIFIHPGCGGSTANMSLQQFATIAMLIADENEKNIICFTGSGVEKTMLKQISKMVAKIRHLVFDNLNIIELMQYINLSQIFISGGTGPLHIAGVLNKKTVAFYPNDISVCATRWKTCNARALNLSISPAIGQTIDNIDVKTKLPQILQLLND